MTPQEAGELLVLMQATWPRLAPDDVSARLWVSDLSTRCEKAIAIDTFRSLRDTETSAPSWATFRAAYENVAKRSQHQPPALEEPEVIKPDPVRLAAMVERARAALTRESSRESSRALAVDEKKDAKW